MQVERELILNKEYSQHNHRVGSQRIKSAGEKPPKVFEYINYREFLQDSLEYKKGRNPRLTTASFLQKAGLGKNSRGYFRLVVEAKRNLSEKTIRGFAQALKLKEKESQFFEALVYYNQAKNISDKNFYFERLAKLAKKCKSQAFEVLESQYNYFSNWYVVAIRELIALDHFQNDSSWIESQLEFKVSKKKIEQALDDLFKLNLITMNEQGELKQTNSCITFTDTDLNRSVVNNFHQQNLDLIQQISRRERSEDVSTSCIFFSTDDARYGELKKDIQIFREQILEKYAQNNKQSNRVFDLSIQLFPLTKKDEQGDLK